MTFKKLFGMKNLAKILQKQPSEGVLKKGALKICIKFTGEHPCQSAFTEIALRDGCSPENLLHIFRNFFPENTSGWLLLIL